MYTLERYAEKKSRRRKLCFVFLLFTLLDLTSAFTWLGIYKEKSLPSTTENKTDCHYIRHNYSITKNQLHMCKKRKESMVYVHEAAQTAVRTCQNMFRYKQWNCSTLALLPKLLPDLKGDTRERGLVNAISSGALTYSIARACSSSSISDCACGPQPDSPPNGNFKWGGCADNLHWGMKFSQRFIDRNPQPTKKSMDGTKQLRQQPGMKKRSLAEDLSSSIQHHNREVGRRIVSESLLTQCVCHGPSGSCNIKTCWKALPYGFYDMGDKLMKAYNSAVQIYENINPEQLTYRVRDLPLSLVFTNKVDYCGRNNKFSTTGRECNDTAHFADSCDKLCCDRGYQDRIIETKQKCNCVYNPNWYNVTCQTCKKSREIYICN